MMYFANRISDNISKREPEGYLFCLNVPIARSGTQQYLQDEIGQSGDKTVTVYRPEDEVFSQATIASFEGMPVTNDHPDAEDGVTAENAQYLAKGHCQNVRRGTGPEKDLLIADLVIIDPQTIQDILDGKREISCGYNYELHEEDGKMVQRQIRGNHIAIVDKGRAGKRVCIKDSAPNNERRNRKMKKGYNRILAKMLAKFAVDAEPDELEEAVDAIEEITSEPEVPVQPEEQPVPEATDAGDEVIQRILARLDALEQKMGATDEDPAEQMDPLARLEKDLDEIEDQSAPAPEPVAEEEEEEVIVPDEDPEEVESTFVDPEAINEQDADEEFIAGEEEEEIPMGDCGPQKDCGPGRKATDAARIALNAIKPVIASLPPSQRKKAADAAVEQIRKASGMNKKPVKNGYAALKARKKRAYDGAAKEAEIGKAIMAKRNPNYKK